MRFYIDKFSRSDSETAPIQVLDLVATTKRNSRRTAVLSAPLARYGVSMGIVEELENLGEAEVLRGMAKGLHGQPGSYDMA